MNDIQIKDLMKIFAEKYPLSISNTADFRSKARFIPPTFSINYFERIIEAYVKYCDYTNTFYQDPEKFLADKWYLDDYEIKLRNLDKNRHREDGDLWFNKYAELEEYFNLHLKPRIMADGRTFNKFIPEARHLIYLKPSYRFDKNKNQLKLNDNCYEISGYQAEWTKEGFNKLTEIEKKRLILKIEIGKMDWLDPNIIALNKQLEKLL